MFHTKPPSNLGVVILFVAFHLKKHLKTCCPTTRFIVGVTTAIFR